MIDLVTIFTRGGAVLWSKQLSTESIKDPQIPINNLVQNVLLEQKSSVQSYAYEHYTLKWCFDNELDLVFVVMYLNLSSLLYIDDLLLGLKKAFCSMFKDEIRKWKTTYDFDDKYEKILTKFEMEARMKSQKRQNRAPRKFSETERGQNMKALQEGTLSKKERRRLARQKAEEEKNAKVDENDEEAVFKRRQAKIAELKAGKMGGRGKKGSKKKNVKPAAPGKKAKELRSWDDRKLTKDEKKALDYSAKNGEATEMDVEQIREQFGSAPEVGDNFAEWKEDPESSEDEGDEKNASSGGLFGFFSGLTGNRVLTRQDVDPVLEQLQSKLMSKNVAQNIAEKLCTSLADSLVGTKQPSFTTLRTTVKQALEKSLTRLLTPNQPRDVLQEIRAAQAQKRPYSIVFIGVNGVGKSTSLAKVCCYFMSKNLKVSITACDTFRSGAIEQLRTHALALKVPLYDRGYDKDASAVASHGINRAQREGRDVVLIDTAGRMQDNEPLMKSLSKLINVNRPDLVLFVGEALVGNDAVDQLTKFNRALVDLSQSTRTLMVDGIILTKFDTIDDKVGAAVSLTYSTGAPIMFVGVGQQYTDLRRMNVGMLIQSLLK